MNAQARVTVTYNDLSQNSYLINEHEDVLDIYRLLDEINRKQNEERHAKMQRGSGVDLTK